MIIVETLHTTIFNELRLRSSGLLLPYSIDQIMITEGQLHCVLLVANRTRLLAIRTSLTSLTTSRKAVDSDCLTLL